MLKGGVSKLGFGTPPLCVYVPVCSEVLGGRSSAFWLRSVKDLLRDLEK